MYSYACVIVIEALTMTLKLMCNVLTLTKLYSVYLTNLIITRVLSRKIIPTGPPCNSRNINILSGIPLILECV